MDSLTAAALHSMVYGQIEAWNAQEGAVDEIKGALLRGCSGEDSKDEVYARMLINSIGVAADISVRAIVEILLASGAAEQIDERRLRKSILSIVKG